MKEYLVKETVGSPVIIWGMYPHSGNEKENLITRLEELYITNCTIIALEVEDWNAEFSPWKTECEGGDFAGNGIHTINYIRDYMIKKIKQKYGNEVKIYFMGYSLAGLFAIWSLFLIDELDGAASCSGSVWFPDFLNYVTENIDKIHSKKIYLSLGGKENNTENKLLSTVLDNTRKLKTYLEERNNVFFEINRGGHFADSGKRLAKAIRWIV